MRKFIIPLISAGCLSALAFFYPAAPQTVQAEKEKKEGESIVGAIVHKNKFLSNWETGSIEQWNRMNAMQQADAMRGGSRAVTELDWEFLGPNNQGGRTRAILVDKDNSNLYLAGMVSGGIYISYDAGLNWELSSDGMENLPIGCLVQDANGTIYAGTGEPHYSAGGFIIGGGTPGNGVYKSTDRGETWTVLPSTYNVGGWEVVCRMAVDPNDDNHLFAALENGGLKQSVDGGTTWSNVSGIGTNCTDVKYSADGTHIFVASGSRIYRSSTDGASFTDITNVSGLTIPASDRRVEIATAPSDPNYVYVLAVANNSCLDKILRSTDGGYTWTTIGVYSASFDPMSSGSYCQGDYDAYIGVNPFDAEKIYVAGIVAWTYSSSTGWKRADNLGGGFSNPYYIHADKHFVTFDPNNKNVMLIGCDGGVFKSTDAYDAFPYPTYSMRNKNYNTFQVYAMGAGLNGDVVGGAQDNGTMLIDYSGNTLHHGTDIYGGDGAFCDISLIKPDIIFSASQYAHMQRSNNRGSSFACIYGVDIDPDGDCEPGPSPDINPFIASSLLVETFDAVGTSKTVTFRNTESSTIAAGTTVSVKSKTAGYMFDYLLTSSLAPNDSVVVPDKIDARFFQATYDGLWFTSNPLNISENTFWFKVPTVPSEVYGLAASKDANVVWAGTTSGRVYKISGFNTADYSNPPAVSGLTVQLISSGAGAVTGIDVNENDPDHVVWSRANYSGSIVHVQHTHDGGASVQSAMGDLPDMPVFNVLIDDYNPTRYIAGTELGIWTSDNEGLNWEENNEGIARVPVYRLRDIPVHELDCHVIYAGTHGHGMWRTTSLNGGCAPALGLAPGLPSEELLAISPNPVSHSALFSFNWQKAQASLQLNIYNLQGALVLSKKLKTNQPGEYKENLDLSSLMSGAYLAVLSDGISKRSVRFVKK